ncbi:aminotransferase class I/II-fold pyridoxal phosphate-dependent enzyme [Candidatus Woesearchaeota archaeon]|nr:aminotransferase class I/II-fold pyridoxal phosphate-dependent enzyme [Candidatus Woesearchaeota archaeon]
MRNISEREEELPDAVIGRLLKIANEDKSVVSLGAGEPNFSLPKPLLSHIKYITKNAEKLRLNHYSNPLGRLDLREAISKKLKKDNKIETDPENIIVSCGSQEALFVGLMCVADITEQVLVPNPSYLGYIPAIELVGASPVSVSLKEEENWEFNPDRIRENIDKKKTKAIIINTPANPTGTVLSKKILEEIADIAVENDLYIFSDEAYEKLIYDSKHISIGSLNGMQDYVLTLQTFSKSYAMCGFRLGYAAGPRKLIEAMEKSMHYVTLTAPVVSQLLGIKALSLPNQYIEKMRKEYDKRRKFIVKRLNELNLPTIEPHGAFYSFSNIKNFSNNSMKFASSLLKNGKVAVVPGTEFGIMGEGYVRCSYAADYDKIVEAMNRLEKFLKKYGK